jgi:hypothetical protein
VSKKSAEKSWVVFTVCGTFHEPSGKAGGLIVRMPSGRVPWCKKIAPAIDKLTKKYSETRDKGNHCWTVEGDLSLPGDKPLWDCVAFAHYEWNGNGLVKTEYQGTPTEKVIDEAEHEEIV